MMNWKTVDEQVVYTAQPYLKVLKQTVEISNGKLIDDFFQVHLRDFVVVVPVLQDGGILMLRQYKHGPGRVSLTFPGGFVEDGECVKEACLRELEEETGYRANTLIHLGEFVDNGNQRGCLGNYFVAAGCTPMTAPHSGDLEVMQIETRSVKSVDLALTEGEFAIIHHASAWSMARLMGHVEV